MSLWRRRREPSADRFQVGRPKDSGIAGEKNLQLCDRIVDEFGSDQRFLQIFALQPIGNDRDLSARRSYQVRHDAAFGRSREKSGSVSVEAAKPSKRERGGMGLHVYQGNYLRIADDRRATDNVIRWSLPPFVRISTQGGSDTYI
jgi:hypothetical protein